MRPYDSAESRFIKECRNGWKLFLFEAVYLSPRLVSVLLWPPQCRISVSETQTWICDNRPLNVKSSESRLVTVVITRQKREPKVLNHPTKSKNCNVYPFCYRKVSTSVLFHLETSLIDVLLIHTLTYLFNVSL